MQGNRQILRTVLYRLPIELREWNRWRGGAARGGAKVFYGFDRLPDPATLSGGLVKVIDLQSAFPNHPRGANVLYLISSALPLFAACMARRAKAAGAKVVLNQNGVAYPGWHGAGWERANRPMQSVLRLADHVFYQSRFCQETANRFLGPRAGAAEVLYNPVDTAAFTPAPQPLPASAGLVLLLAGSHHGFYRVQSALDCLALVRRKLPAARLHIAGRCLWSTSEAAAEAGLRSYIAGQGLESAVELSGPYSPASAASLLRGAHILLHTKYNDPCPRLVVEAMACALPVVYSATGGVPELVGDTAGLGVPGPVDYEQDHPPSPAALAEAVLTIAGRLPDFSRAARARAVARFDAGPWLNRHREVFDALLRSRSAA